MAVENRGPPGALTVVIEAGRVVGRVPSRDLGTALGVPGEWAERAWRDGRPPELVARVEAAGEVIEVEFRRRPGKGGGG